MKRLLRRCYEPVRYESARWPLWRWDMNLRYIAKSLWHVPAPASPEDQTHYAAMFRYLEARRAPTLYGRKFRLGALGDLMWIRSGYERVLSPALHRAVSDADVLFANLETPTDPAAKVQRWVYETLHYNAPPEYLAPFARTRPEQARVVSLCNNHALDQGFSGLAATRRAVLSRPGFSCLGGPSAGDESALVSVQGVTLGCLGITFGINHQERYATPWGIPQERFGDPAHEPNWDALSLRIQALREAGADVIVLVPHWGYEYEYWPDAKMREHAHRLVSLGADVIIGSSPHVLQPIEVVSVDGWDSACPVQLQRGGPPRAAVIMYSLGNFASIMPTLACQTGALASLELGLSRDGALSLGALRVTPTACFRGLGATWLDARAVTLGELPPERAAQHRDYAAQTLGPLLNETPPGGP
jgi:poly-gamma-glutamate synthesis protein (capsule biosynthesis protein)